jgi:predicted transcriptional regulator
VESTGCGLLSVASFIKVAESQVYSHSGEMARKHEAEQLLKEGMCPAAIAGRMGISTKSVIQYLRTRVGEGALRLSDLYFSWSPEQRRILQEAVEDPTSKGQLEVERLTLDDLECFQSLRDSSVFYGDMYEHVSSIEISLHRLMRKVLQRSFGAEEMGWWRGGIPENIRVKCVSRREEDDEPAVEAFAYTTFIDLSRIILCNWNLFRPELPKRYQSDRKRLEGDLTRLNRIRNAVMHPVKGRKWSEDDFEFVRHVADAVGQTYAR